MSTINYNSYPQAPEVMLDGGALTDYTGFAIVLFSGVAVVSLFVLRQREWADQDTQVGGV